MVKDENGSAPVAGLGGDGERAWKDRHGAPLADGDRVSWCGYLGKLVLRAPDARETLRPTPVSDAVLSNAFVRWNDGVLSRPLEPSDAARWLEKVS